MFKHQKQTADITSNALKKRIAHVRKSMYEMKIVFENVGNHGHRFLLN
jgi:hypothetical protein